MSYFVGLDVSLRSVALCLVDADGDIVMERALDCEVEAIDGYLRQFDKPITKLGFEAGVMSQMLFHGLQALGYEVVCMESRQVSAALSAMRNKTDKNDARGIAQVVRSGWYQPVHMKSRESHYIRAMLSSRKAVLRKCVDLENEIRGLFKTFGIRLPSTLAHHRFDDTVRTIIEADEGLAFALTPMLEARGALYAHYREMDKRVKRVAAQDPVCNLLMTTPGVGAMTALHFKAAVDDPARFNSSRTVAAHFGLTPRRFQSGEMDNPRPHITRRRYRDESSPLHGCKLLTHQNQTNVAAQVVGTTARQTTWPQRGTVAVARKLAVILHRMWVDGTPYRWSDVEVAK